MWDKSRSKLDLAASRVLRRIKRNDKSEMDGWSTIFVLQYKTVNN